MRTLHQFIGFQYEETKRQNQLELDIDILLVDDGKTCHFVLITNFKLTQFDPNSAKEDAEVWR